MPTAFSTRLKLIPALTDIPSGQSMYNGNPTHRATATPEALFQLELLLQERAVDLAAVTDIVTKDPGLSTHVLHLTHDMGDMTEVIPSLQECIVEIGIEGLRESLRNARMRRRSN